MWYLCGLGSNIDPKRNLPRALARLVRLFGPLSLSPVIRTAPQGMDSDNSFLNALVVFQSELPPDQVKQCLNELEEALGRDRSDPLSGVRDRPIDVDILKIQRCPAFTDDGITEAYYRALLAGGRVAGEQLLLQGQSLGEAPATIDWNQGAGHEVIVQHGDDLLHHTVKAALPG